MSPVIVLWIEENVRRLLAVVVVDGKVQGAMADEKRCRLVLLLLVL